MRPQTTLYTIIALLCLSSFQTQAFIERRYTLKEVINESTNILFGTVTSVNQKRLTAKVKVEENLKGKSDFQEIKIRLDTGQGNFPQKMIKKLEVGLPIIIFYAKHGTAIDSIGHVNGTWFQSKTQDLPDKNRVWWYFTHIEIYMHRTFNGTTPDFQTHLRDVLGGKTKPAVPKTLKAQQPYQASEDSLRVLVLTGNHYDVEFPALSHFDQIGKHRVVYQKTKDRGLPELGKADILWIGGGEICESNYVLTTYQEKRIKAFVKSGGIVIVSEQDSDDDRPCDTGWLPEPLKGVDRWGRSDFQPTRAAGTLFTKPNEIKSGEVFIDDAWTGWTDKYTILATTNGGKDIAAGMLKYGKGMYLITSFQNETSANIFVNRPMMENLIHFAVGWLSNQ